MLLNQIDIEGYRSIKSLWLNLSRVNVLVGPNGCGKSNLYRGLWLLQAAANGQFAQAIASEGGMASALWAGRKGAPRMTIAARLEDLKYRLEVGLPPRGPDDPTLFKLDPQVKEEHVWIVQGSKKAELLKRTGSSVVARDERGAKITYPLAVPPGESVLSELREPHKFPELSMLRQEILHWRFYHQFRTDIASPIRQPQIGVYSPVLNHDGLNLAAAIQTIVEIGDDEALSNGIDRAFPGSEVFVENNDGQFTLSMHMPGFARPFKAQELSDGTIQYLCLLAALLSPRPPALLALNEPETSIHPDLFEPLARLIADASKHSQLWITTHARELADYILDFTGAAPIELEKVDGATRIVGQKLGGFSNDDDGDDS